MNIKRLAAAAAALMMLGCACAHAQETTPLAGHAQQEPAAQAERADVFVGRRGYGGVEASRGWLYQARLGNVSLNLRVFLPSGEQLTFQEELTPAGDSRSEIKLTLRAASDADTLLLQLDQAAVDTLARLNITQIVVTDTDMHVRGRYQVSDLAAMRALFSLGERELLCVSGENDPVTVVSVDGVRRQLTE